VTLEEALGILDAVLATGGGLEEALAGLDSHFRSLLSQGIDLGDAFVARLAGVLDHRSADKGIAILDGLAKLDPVLAQRILIAWGGTTREFGDDLNLRTRQWATALPDGLTFGYDVLLEGTSITTLPDGLKVNGWLDLAGTAIRSLPEGLRVGELDLRGCRLWDGGMPPDTRVGNGIFTDVHPNGISISSWRKAHPNGERG
jgi:hypothetical protein